MSKESHSVEGYELGYSEEGSSGAFGSYGIKVFVKQARPFRDEDSAVFYEPARMILNGLRTNIAKADLRGLAERQQSREKFIAIFAAAGLSPVFVEEIQNGYCSDPCCLNRPWFVVTSSIGHIKIGWRKSVINIDWSRSIVKTAGKDLFPSENVTRGEAGEPDPQTIHAWGYDKATDYLARIRLAAEEGKVPASGAELAGKIP